MPTSVVTETFECEVCGKVFSYRDDAVSCEVAHDLIYVPIARSDLKRLLSFLVSGNPEYLTETLVDTLRKYNKIGAQ